MVTIRTNNASKSVIIYEDGFAHMSFTALAMQDDEVWFTICESLLTIKGVIKSCRRQMLQMGYTLNESDVDKAIKQYIK